MKNTNGVYVEILFLVQHYHLNMRPTKVALIFAVLAKVFYIFMSRLVQKDLLLLNQWGD